MNYRWSWLIGLVLAIGGCAADGSGMLDKGIPRVETPAEQIATVRLKTYDGRPSQTALLDQQGRVLEEYCFGLSSSRVRNQYEGALKTYSITHYHSDSSEPGYVDISESQYQYDKQGRLILEERTREKRKQTIRYTYTPTGDTLRSVEPAPETHRSTVTNVDRWERNGIGQVVRRYRLFVMKMPQEKAPDTVWHSSQRYMYRPDGKRIRAWYDYMHLGRFYLPAGPDTIDYQYDQAGRLIGERHRYTTDMRNKQEVDSTRFRPQDRWHLRQGRQRFFEGSGYGTSSNDRTHQVQYQYEPFDAKRHLPLHVPERT